MKTNTIVILLMLLALKVKSQKIEFEIKDICPTQTSTAIHARFIFPFKIKMEVEKTVYRTSYRKLYRYIFKPFPKKYKSNIFYMYFDERHKSDSTFAISKMADGYKNIVGYPNIMYNETEVIAWKGYDAFERYNFTLQVKHNQNKESFDVNKLLWFVDIAKSWRLEHGNHH